MIVNGKRGQLAIFIITAILIIGAVALFFVLKKDIGQKESYSPEASPVVNFVQECLDDSLESAVFDIGEKGGYYNPLAALSTELFNTPYYLKDGKNKMPKKEIIEGEISKQAFEYFEFCINDFSSFSGYNISSGSMNAKTKIEDEKTSMSVNYPLRIKKGDSVSRIEKFDSETEIRMGVVYNAVEEFIMESENSPEAFCVTCLTEIMAKNDLKATVVDYDENTNVFMVNDPFSKINEREFVWVFANEYSI